MVQWLVLVYESFVYVMKKLNQWKIRPNQAEKNAEVLLPIEKLNGYAFMIEKISSDVIRCEMNATGIAVSSRTIRRR